MAGAAKMPPTAVPALMMPMAVERSRMGNHSATALVAAGKAPPSPMPEQEAAGGEHAEGGGQAVAGAGERPDDHDEEEPEAGAQRVDEFSADDVHEAVGEQECGVEMGEFFVGDVDMLADFATATGKVWRSK